MRTKEKAWLNVLVCDFCECTEVVREYPLLRLCATCADKFEEKYRTFLKKRFVPERKSPPVVPFWNRQRIPRFPEDD